MFVFQMCRAPIKHANGDIDVLVVVLLAWCGWIAAPVSIGFQSIRFNTLRRKANRFVATTEFAKLSEESLPSADPEFVDRLAAMVLVPERRGEPGPRRLLALGLLVRVLPDKVAAALELVVVPPLPADEPEAVAVFVPSACVEFVVLFSGSINTTCNRL